MRAQAIAVRSPHPRRVGLVSCSAATRRCRRTCFPQTGSRGTLLRRRRAPRGPRPPGSSSPRVHMRQACAVHGRCCRCGRGEPSPGADAAGAIPVPAQGVRTRPHAGTAHKFAWPTARPSLYRRVSARSCFSTKPARSAVVPYAPLRNRFGVCRFGCDALRRFGLDAMAAGRASPESYHACRPVR